MKQIASGAVATVVLLAAAAGQAQSPTISELKGKIFDAHMAQKLFANGLKHCGELDGKTRFYLGPRDRVLNMADYHRSLESLANGHVFNPETRRPWNAEDAATRWAMVQQEALKNKEDCDLVASLPNLEKQLEELERNSNASAK